MTRRPLAWLVAVPLMTAGSLTAHALAYRIVEPDSAGRLDLLTQTGHGYMASLPLVLGAAFAVAIAGLAAHASRALSGRPAAQPAAWPLALLPVLGFVFQEHLERLVASGDLPLAAVTEPTFLIGLLLQLPFALAALVVARALSRAAEALGRALRTPPRPSARPRDARRPVVAVLPNAPRLAAAHSGRGPPS